MECVSSVGVAVVAVGGSCRCGDDVVCEWECGQRGDGSFVGAGVPVVAAGVGRGVAWGQHLGGGGRV